jgi:hypothetical protein
LTRGHDQDFRLVAQNKSASNTPGSEVSRFGLAYGTTIRTGFAFMRGLTGDDIAMAVLAGNGIERMRVTAGGLVGIGTNSPAYLLHVNGIAVSSGFITASDARIKRITGRSDPAADLATLQRIEVTDYSFIDPTNKGTGKQKKVIAQQVQKVFPQAVSLSTGVVPDISQKATIKGGWVTLATDLKPGERVRLIADQKESIHEVLEVAPGKFRTDFATDGAEVFVYGREVKDFRSVDYEAIAMLHVSATQQLKRDTDAELASLRAENAALRAQLAAQDSRVAAIEKMLATSTTVMALPAKAPTASGQ